MRHKIITVVGAVVILSVVATSGEEGKVTDENKPKQEVVSDGGKTEATEEKVYKINDVVNFGEFELQVTNIEEMSTIGDPDFLGAKAAEAAKYIAVQYKIKKHFKRTVRVLQNACCSVVR